MLVIQLHLSDSMFLLCSMALGMCPTRERMMASFEFANEEEAAPVIISYCAAAHRTLNAVNDFLTRSDLHFPDKA